MAAVALVALVQWAVARFQPDWLPGWLYYLAGWWDAERELWQGTATFSEFEYEGGLIRDNSSCVELVTGLRVVSRTGCVVRARDRARAQGHNDHIRQYIRWHGLPGNSIKPWERIVFDLKRWFDQQARAQAPTCLVAGGPPAVGPGGSACYLRPATTRYNGVGFEDRALMVVVSRGAGVAIEWPIGADEPTVDLLWGPSRSGLVVIRSRGEGRESYTALDLKGCGYLRTETWIDGKTEDDGWEHLLAVTGRGLADESVAPAR
jgi:hypothetical protein